LATGWIFGRPCTAASPRLANRIDMEQRYELIGAIAGRVPIVTIGEQTEWQRQNAETTEKLWAGIGASASEKSRALVAMRDQVIAAIDRENDFAAKATSNAAEAKDALDKLTKGEAAGCRAMPICIRGVYGICRQKEE
jgi:hypothetical protein